MKSGTSMKIKSFRIAPDQAVDLAAWSPRSTEGFAGDKAAAAAETQRLVTRLAQLQDVLFAQAEHRLLVVLQAPDAGGKDGTIRAILTGVNPQGTDVVNFKQPTDAELAHDYLWRVHAHTPAKGEIVVFNRSHYEDVLVVKVHQLVPDKQLERRYDHINAFEQMLVDEGTTIIKLFLHISPEEQAARLQERLDDPSKRWKFRKGDLDERARWEDYRQAYQTMLQRTSTPAAPWYVVPADRNWFRNLVVAEILVQTLEGFDMTYPEPDKDLDGLKVT